jgi:hypothetical protein
MALNKIDKPRKNFVAASSRVTMEQIKPHRALEQLDIIHLIIDQLSGDTTTLLAAALVNRLWSAVGLAMLWDEPRPQMLAAVADDDRRRFYAGFVSRIVSDNFGDDLMKWARLLRPQVLEVPPQIERLKGTAYRLMLCRSLRSLRCSISAVARQTMRKNLARLCPSLSELVLLEPKDPAQPGPNDLAVVLQKQARLAKLVFRYNERFTKKGFPSRIIEDLAGRETLRLLKTTGRVSTACLARVYRDNPQPFRNLDSLRIRVHSNAVWLLAKWLPRLTNLKLELCDSMHNPFPHLASWTRLNTLGLALPEGNQISPEDFARIKQLGSQLCSLRLSSLMENSLELKAPSFTDRDLLSLIAAFPRLRVFKFIVTSRLSANALRLVGEQCPHLERLVLPCFVDLRTLDGVDTPLFPSLTDLSLGGVFQHDTDEG